MLAWEAGKTLAPALGEAWIERARLAVLRGDPHTALTMAERALVAAPASPYVQRIVRAGGLVPFTREELAARASGRGA